MLKTEEMTANPQAALDSICRFLNVAPHQFSQSRHLNARDYERPMTDDERAYLLEVYEPHIAAVENLLGWDCTDWRPNGGLSCWPL